MAGVDGAAEVDADGSVDAAADGAAVGAAVAATEGAVLAPLELQALTTNRTTPTSAPARRWVMLMDPAFRCSVAPVLRSGRGLGIPVPTGDSLRRWSPPRITMFAGVSGSPS